MNSRVRERGLTSKETAFNRDQVSNDVKLSNDELLAEKQTKNRENRHPKVSAATKEKYKIGDNVFLKSDKSKLRGREMYKIVKLFQKNDENWAIVQKCESKFMSKEYEVKFSEIFPVPHTQTDIDSDLDNVEMQKSDDAMDEDEHDTQSLHHKENELGSHS